LKSWGDQDEKHLEENAYDKRWRNNNNKTKLNSVALVRERTIPTERPPPVGEVSANLLIIIIIISDALPVAKEPKYLNICSD